MLAKREIWQYRDEVRIWAGKYRNSHNLLHWHYDCELIYVEQGGIDVFCERRRHALSVGQALFMDLTWDGKNLIDSLSRRISR